MPISSTIYPQFSGRFDATKARQNYSSNRYSDHSTRRSNQQSNLGSQPTTPPLKRKDTSITKDQVDLKVNELRKRPSNNGLKLEELRQKALTILRGEQKP